MPYGPGPMQACMRPFTESCDIKAALSQKHGCFGSMAGVGWCIGRADVVALRPAVGAARHSMTGAAVWELPRDWIKRDSVGTAFVPKLDYLQR